MIKKFDKNRKNDNLKVNDYVMYYIGERSYTLKTLRPRFIGPFKITARINHNTVKIYNEYDGKEITCHTQKLKKYRKNEFTAENDYLKQYKQKLKLENNYRRRKGSKIKRLK